MSTPTKGRALEKPHVLFMRFYDIPDSKIAEVVEEVAKLHPGKILPIIDASMSVNLFGLQFDSCREGLIEYPTKEAYGAAFNDPKAQAIYMAACQDGAEFAPRKPGDQSFGI